MYAYTLVEQPIVVHLDVNSIILIPVGAIYDSIIDGAIVVDPYNLPAAGSPPPSNSPDRRVLHSRLQSHCLYWSCGGGAGKIPRCEDGTFRIREVSTKLPGGRSLSRIRMGGGKVHGVYYGVQQIQGLYAHYYDFVRPGTSMELDQCVYNSMVDGPYATGNN